MASYRDMWIEIDEPEDIGDVGFFLEAREMESSQPGRGCAFAVGSLIRTCGCMAATYSGLRRYVD
jgi:hypothetical protein